MHNGMPLIFSFVEPAEVVAFCHKFTVIGLRHKSSRQRNSGESHYIVIVEVALLNRSIATTNFCSIVVNRIASNRSSSAKTSLEEDRRIGVC